MCAKYIAYVIFSKKHILFFFLYSNVQNKPKIGVTEAVTAWSNATGLETRVCCERAALGCLLVEITLATGDWLLAQLGAPLLADGATRDLRRMRKCRYLLSRLSQVLQTGKMRTFSALL